MDLDGDGHKDMLSGSWPGELFFFRGIDPKEMKEVDLSAAGLAKLATSLVSAASGPRHPFAPPVKLKFKDGKTINIGGGIQRDTDEELLIAGDVKWERSGSGNTILVYDGQRIEVPEGKQAMSTGTASAVHAVDWDSDGDLDLLVGNIRGAVYLVPNEGDRKSNVFGKEVELTAGDKPIQVAHGDAGPFTADWDGDGDLDLLVGAGDGSVELFRNDGSSGQPKLAEGQTLVSAAEVSFGDDAPKEARRGMRSKICVADWNGDGRLDLLVGDFTTQKPDAPEPSAAEKAVYDKMRTELADVRKEYTELNSKLFGFSGTKRVTDKDERNQLEEKRNQVVQKMMQIQGKLPPEYENHGWVWLFVRK